MKNDPSLKSQAKAIFIGNLFGTLFQFLIPAIVVRLISKEDFGVFRQFQLVGATFIGILGMGYSASLFYFYPILDSIGKKKIIQQTHLLFILNIIAFSVLFYYCGNQILTYLNFKEFIDLKVFLVMYISFMLFSSIIVKIFILEKNTLLNKIFPAIDRISRFFLLILLILLIPGVKGPIIALVAYSLLRLLFYLKYISQYLKEIQRIDLKLIKEQVIYSIPFGFAVMLNMASTKFDKFFINQYITPEEFGIYSISFLGIPILTQFYQSIRNVVIPQISLFIKDDKLDHATKLWKKTVDKISNITIPAVILFWLLADEIITILYTIDYIDAANYYRIFILSFFISMFSSSIILRGANKTKYILISNIIGVVFTIIIGIFLIPKIGLYGAVITALFGKTLPMLITLNIERKIMRLSLKNWVDWKKICLNFLICLLVALPLFIFKDYIINIYIRTLFVGSFFVIIVILLQVRFNLFISNRYLIFVKKTFRL